jgi:hypothetical protein
LSQLNNPRDWQFEIQSLLDLFPRKVTIGQALGVSPETIRRWDLGTQIPLPNHVDDIHELYQFLFQAYKMIRFAWYYDYVPWLAYPDDVPVRVKGRYRLNMRIVLTGTVKKEHIEGFHPIIQRKLIEEMKSSTVATAVYIANNTGRVDEVLQRFYRRHEHDGTYGEIETLSDAEKYDEQWKYYGFFRNEDLGEEYEWNFKWRIKEW